MRFSIITPSFRQIDYLRLCAASVADQAGEFSHEHLVQDGGSGEEFATWAAEQSFAQVRSEPDSGMYDAINRGFNRAEGEILAWLNCDEQYLPGALAKVAAWFEAHPDKDILFGDVVLVAPNGSPLSYRQAVTPLRDHIRHCFLATYSAATFVRRRAIDEGHWLDTNYRAIADAVWIEELLEAGYRPGVLNEPLAVFTQTGENLGQTPAAEEENRRWSAEKGAGSAMGRMWWSVLHRVRKFAKGSYRPREVAVSLYVPGTEKRVERLARVGGRWRTTLED